MKFVIKHEIPGRIRVCMAQPHMTFRQADLLQYYLQGLAFVTSAKVREKTCGAVVCYTGDRSQVVEALRRFEYGAVQPPPGMLENTGRELNARYREKLVLQVLIRFAAKLFLPAPLQHARVAAKSLKYLWHGLRCLGRRRLEVPVLDAAAIGVSLLRQDFNTAGSVMFLLGVGEILEEWTHKKSVSDLARSMSLNVGRVWLRRDGQEVLVKASQVQPGDCVVVRMGSVVPFDGVVALGEGMVNQASLTGESLPVRKEQGGYVYAGTVLEEGELAIQVKKVSGSTRYEKIMGMIEESEKLKSRLEGKAAHLADRLVPYTFLGTVLTWALTRNVTKALAVLMVDFSCALKLAMPISVLSAIREASAFHITVKGGKYLEALAEASTIVFDKTGTLTRARPTVKEVVPFGSHSAGEALRLAACLEEHFPHSMAKAVVRAAREQGLEHEEMHSKVDYIVAHGIASYIGEKRVVIGSHHFVFEDEGCTVRSGRQAQFDSLPAEYSHLYLAVDHVLEAVICIEDPLREEAPQVVRRLKEAGLQKVVMMTGDSERTAAAVARRVGVDEYYSEVLPEDKAAYVRREREAGRTVIMVGDGINDSPALSAANVGVAVSEGAEIAREIADVTVAANDLRELVRLRRLSQALMKRIRENYRAIVGVNGALILLGVAGVVPPATSALLHNASTLAISLKSMQNLLPEQPEGEAGE